MGLVILNTAFYADFSYADAKHCSAPTDKNLIGVLNIGSYACKKKSWGFSRLTIETQDICDEVIICKLVAWWTQYSLLLRMHGIFFQASPAMYIDI